MSKSSRDIAVPPGFDHSRLSSVFSALSKPARRALSNAGISAPADLSEWTIRELGALHGIGPTALPHLQRIMRDHGVDFRADA